MRRRIIAVFCAFIFLVMVLMPVSTAYATTEEINAFTFYYDKLNERQQFLYNWLKDYMDNLAPQPARYREYLMHFLPEKATEQDCSKLWTDLLYAGAALVADDPMYEIKGKIGQCAWASPGEEFFFYVDIERPELPTEDIQKRMEARIQQLVSIAGTGDRYTQLRRLMSYLIETSFYDPYLGQLNMEGSPVLNDRGLWYNATVMGLMLEGIAICDGFADSVKLLCNELNIPCIIMGNKAHAWNLVQMEDGQWYRVDLTNVSRLGWDGNKPETQAYFEDIFLNNHPFAVNSFDDTYSDPYMLNVTGNPKITEFPEHAAQRYQYTGSTTDFSYSVADSTYIPGDPKFSYRVNGDGKSCTITNYEGMESGELMIPETLDGYTVTAIDSYAFYYCTGFTGQLTIPDTVETIGKAAFAGCYNISSVRLPANLHQLGIGAFIGCKGLTELNLPDLVDTIEDYAFWDCNGLRTVSFGSHIQNIGIGAFGQIALDAVLNGPADSVAQTRAAEAGLMFQSNGTLCAFEDTDGKWEYRGEQHFHTCEHGGQFDHEIHHGTHCCWECPVCGAWYCGNTDEYSEIVPTLVNATPATCVTPKYTGDYQCTCGNIGKYGGYFGGLSDQHVPTGDTWEYDDAAHWKICICGQEVERADHCGAADIFSLYITCSVCGVEYVNAIAGGIVFAIILCVLAVPLSIFIIFKKKK